MKKWMYVLLFLLLLSLCSCVTTVSTVSFDTYNAQEQTQLILSDPLYKKSQIFGYGEWYEDVESIARGEPMINMSFYHILASSGEVVDVNCRFDVKNGKRRTSSKVIAPSDEDGGYVKTQGNAVRLAHLPSGIFPISEYIAEIEAQFAVDFYGDLLGSLDEWQVGCYQSFPDPDRYPEDVRLRNSKITIVLAVDRVEGKGSTSCISFSLPHGDTAWGYSTRGIDIGIAALPTRP